MNGSQVSRSPKEATSFGVPFHGVGSSRRSDEEGPRRRSARTRVDRWVGDFGASHASFHGRRRLRLWCSDDDAEALIRSFVRRGFTIDALLMTKSTKRIATVRLKPPGSEVLVDLLFDFTGIEREIVESATEAEVHPGFEAPVATIPHLIAMKVLAFRQKDLVDLESLFEAAGSADLALARKAVDAISRAGKEPKRDLSADLERLLAERELPDDAFIKVPRSELAKRFGRKPTPRRKR